jgi:hypothetical protein
MHTKAKRKIMKTVWLVINILVVVSMVAWTMSFAF